MPVHVVLDAGRFRTTADIAAFDQILDRFEAASDGPALVVHFHGGLVSEESGTSHATQVLGPLYQRAGGIPLCMVWRTGILEVLEKNLSDIAGEAIFKRLLALVLRRVGNEVLGGAVADAAGSPIDRLVPLTVDGALPDPDRVAAVLDAPALALSPRTLADAGSLAQFEAEVATDPIVVDTTTEIVEEPGDAVLAASLASESGQVRLSVITLMSPEVVSDIRRAGSPGATADATLAGLGGAAVVAVRAAKVLFQVVRRLTTKRGHGVYATVVEELLREFYVANVAQKVWGEMKRFTEQAFEGPAEQCGGTALVQRLAGMLERDRRPRVLLVGHSAGSIFVCRLLEAANAAFSRIRTEAAARFAFDVVLLAPAVRYDDFDQVVRGVGTRIGGFRMFAMRDELERADTLIDRNQLTRRIYPHSLLYFVSGVCESDGSDVPLLGMQRFHRFSDPFAASRFPHIQRVRDWLGRRAGRLVWTTTDAAAPAGLRSQADDHGAFDDDAETLDSLASVIEDGSGLLATLTEAAVPAGTLAMGPSRIGGFPAGGTGEGTAAFDPMRFTGRWIVRMPRGGRAAALAALREGAGIASVERPDASATLAEILDASAAAELPRFGIAIASLTEEQVARVRGGAGLASLPDGFMRLMPERYAYIANDPRLDLLAYADGVEHGVRAAVGLLRERAAAGAPQVAASAPSAAPASPPSGMSGALRMLGVSEAGQGVPIGRGIRVCVIDTGLDLEHPDFVAPRFTALADRRVVARSFVPGLPPQDHHGHGTHCAGLACGSADTEAGYRYGAAPGADLYVARVFDQYTRAAESAVLDALGWALDEQCHIASMSLVFSTVSPENDQLFTDVARDALDAGLVLFAATGNNSDRRLNPQRLSAVQFPAFYPDVVAVAALDNAAPAGVTFFSACAAPPRENRKPDVAAPGLQVPSAWLRPMKYRLESGTSMATPLAAGIAALRAEATGLRGAALRTEVFRTATMQGLTGTANDLGRGIVQA